MSVSAVDEGGSNGSKARSTDTHTETKQFQPDSHWKEAPNRECYSSFGDNGTTATVNAYGNIMQFSKYLGKGHSGMFSVDHACVSEPYVVMERTTDLQNLIDESVYDKDETYGAHFPDLDFLSYIEPELTFVHNRWPRIDRTLRHDWIKIYNEWKRNDPFNMDFFTRPERIPFSKLSTTWMAYQGIVFQNCVVKNNSSKDELLIEIDFAENMLIRDLDHLDPKYSSNEEKDDNYVTFLGPKQQSWVRLHQFQRPKGEQNPERQGKEEVATDSVAVVVSVFINNELQSWCQAATDPGPIAPTTPDQSDTPVKNSNAETTDNDERPEGRKPKWAYTLAPKKTLEITFAYEMRSNQDFQTNQDFQNELANSFGHVDKSFIERVQNILREEPVEGTFSLASLLPVIEEMIIPHWMFHTGNETEENESNQRNNIEGRYTSRLEDPSGEITSMSPLHHLEFFARRNLEHILSVCAIPIHSDDKRLEGLEELNARPVALTCGDMAFHRVNTGASFFAFEFLIETSRRLQQLPISKHEQAKSLLDRIQPVCIGHLLWLIIAAPENQPFAANYWISGAKTNVPHTDSWQPKDSPTDSAFQWIKIQECFDIFGEVLRRYKEAILDALQPGATAWREQLKLLDAKTDCAWPHAREDGTNTFRLDDHIWIWRGLKAIEDIEDYPQKSEDTFNAWMDQTRQRIKKQKGHDSKNVQQTVIRHFTTKNDFSAKRTLAVTRSSRETRFLFHSRDTVLLYAREWDFISTGDSNAMEVWQNAMWAQPDHEENQEFAWESALHYALSILMALKGFSINRRPSPDVLKDSLATLTQSSFSNGLFAGLLDKTTKKDDIFHREADRDFYFHAGFEISFILFRNAHAIIESWNPKTGPSQKRDETDQDRLNKAIEHFAQIITQHTLTGRFDANATHVPDNAGTQSQKSPLRTSTMKKSMPVNLFIDADSVVDIGDEWLYNYPGFMASEQTAALPLDVAVRSLRDRKCREDSILRETPEETEWLDRILDKSREITDLNRNTTNCNATEEAVAVFDIAKKSRTEKDGDGATKDDPPMLDVDGLWTRLCSPRDPRSSKKRFVWLQSSDEDIALRCYLASHVEEKPAISMFFDRNSKAEHFFHDETTMFLNTWETELHLSFYQLFKSDDSTSSSKAKLRGIDFTFPKNGEHTIAKASMGFRFSGDFFDRFWTCHLLELTSGKHTKWDLWLKDPSEQHRNSKYKAWGQRKVLELHLFERILIALVGSTKELFETLKSAVNLEGYGKDVFFLDNKDLNYSESSRDWEDLQQSLKHIIDELERVDGTIVKWQAREKDRGAERPRWTRNDETKYRGDINKLKVSTNHKVQEFKSLHLEIKSFREWLMSYQEQIREEISFRNAENIKFFTYVTVVFLPLGFASSIFSMSGVPEQDLIGNMVTMAIVALLITVLAILSAPVVKFGFNHAFENSLKSWKDHSILFRLNARPVETQKDTKSATDDTSEESTKSTNIKQEPLADEEAPNRSSSSGETHVAKSPDAGRQHYRQRRRGVPNTIVWLWYILTELPAQIVISAYDGMSSGQISMTTVFSVVIGIIVLPWCFIALLARIIAVNLADLIHIISSLIFQTFDKIFNRKERPQKPLEFLLQPSDKLRPLKSARDKLAKQEKEKQPGTMTVSQK